MTRAVLLARYGAVHRIVVQSDGSDGTACRSKGDKAVEVRPVQALVYHLEPCEDGRCWGVGRWREWINGVRK